MSFAIRFLTSTFWIVILLNSIGSISETLRKSCGTRRTHVADRRYDKLYRFLSNVLKAQEQLNWIDQIANQMRSKEIYYSSSLLQNKMNALFFNKKREILDPLKNKKHKNIFKHRKRNPCQIKNLSENLKKVKCTKTEIFLPNKEYENVLLHTENSNAMANFKQKNRLNNVIPITLNPLEKLLRSINVFPVKEDPCIQVKDITVNTTVKSNDNNFKNDFKPKFSVFETTTSIPLFTTSNNLLRNKHHRLRRSWPKDMKTLGKKFKELLTFSNKDDRSQISRALHDNLAKEIVNTIFNQIQNKNESNTVINLRFYDDIKSLNSSVFENLSRKKLDYISSNQITVKTNNLMELAQQLIFDIIEKKFCPSLTPDLHNFLQWLLDFETSQNHDNKSTEKLKIKGEQLKHLLKTSSYSNNDSSSNLNDWYKNANILKNLLLEYKRLSKIDKNKVQAIYDYLVTMYDFVKSYIETFNLNLLISVNVLKI